MIDVTFNPVVLSKRPVEEANFGVKRPSLLPQQWRTNYALPDATYNTSGNNNILHFNAFSKSEGLSKAPGPVLGGRRGLNGEQALISRENSEIYS